MIETQLLDKLTSLVTSHRRILVVSHKNCGDATGAVTACKIVLERLGKKVTVFLPAPVSKIFNFLPKTETIIFEGDKINWSDYDLFLCVDAAEPMLTGLGDKFSSRPKNLLTINFDHHLTNPGYGDFNVLDKSASATCAMLYEWFERARWEIDHDVATCLLTGILTDTGSFSNPGTNANSLGIAANLLKQGANIGKFLTEVVKNKTVAELKLWGKAFERLQVNEELAIVTTVITRQDVEELNLNNEAIEGMANFLNEMSGYKAIMVLKEQADGTIKGSLRTTRDDVDVAAIAQLFGGGGHKKAAGFTVQGKLVLVDGYWQVEQN